MSIDFEEMLNTCDSSQELTYELKIRNQLLNRGFTFGFNDKKLSIRPNIVFPELKTVIFVYDCFSNDHTKCIEPKSTTDVLLVNLEKNQNQEVKDLINLSKKSWNVIVLYKCTLQLRSLNKTMDNLSETLVDRKLHLKNRYRKININSIFQHS